jgi:hypothetical protein
MPRPVLLLYVAFGMPALLLFGVAAFLTGISRFGTRREWAELDELARARGRRLAVYGYATLIAEAVATLLILRSPGGIAAITGVFVAGDVVLLSLGRQLRRAVES